MLVPRFAALVAFCTGAVSALASPASARNDPTVAVLETHAPLITEFVLHGTFPIPPGTFHGASEGPPFAILDFDGAEVLTQTEIVSRYPDEADGADVVEVLARVHRDPLVLPGTILRYRVVEKSLRYFPEDVLDGSDSIPQAVTDFLLDTQAIEIRSSDCFGNRYVSRPLGGERVVTVLRHGPVLAEVRIHQTMMPEPEVAGSTLPHFLDVDAYVRWFRGGDMVPVDLRITNAQDGHDRTSAEDDPLDKVYFRSIEVALPQDWTILQDVQDPFMGDQRLEGTKRVGELVAPLPAGKLHVLRWQGQFHRRLMIAHADLTARAEVLTYLNGLGQAFCARDFDPDGREYWSWWNRETSRYFPQRHVLPRLDHIGRDALEAELVRLHDQLVAHLTSGSGDGTYPFNDPVLGWGHPYGVSYGGMTGGLEIDCYDGVATAAAASNRGYRMFQLLHRMQTDRMPDALYQRDGQPSSVEEWLVENGDADYVPWDHYVVPLLFGSHPDPFGFHNAPRFQINFVQARGLAPDYENRHFSFDPYDYQHYIRYTRSAKVLAWLGNDALAKDDLRMQAENFELGYHPYFNNSNGMAQGSGMRAMQDYVRQFPHQGFPFGRGESWGIDCAAAAYSLAEPEWRARKRPWFEALAELVSAGQAACSGFIQAFVSEKAVGGNYQARQQIEQSITENMLVGLHESVFRGADPGHAAMVRDSLVSSLYAFIGEMAWFPGEYGPWRYTGVGPLDPHLPVWCSRAEMPDDAWTAGDIEAFQDWSSFAYGYELTHDTTFLRHARFQTGGADFDDLERALKADGTDNLENRAALLAIVEIVNGEL